MRAIADALERAPSTISRELRRHRHARQYLPDHAQRLSEHRRTQASRCARIDAERIARIELLLAEDFSPEQIAVGDWELDTLRASHGKAVVVSMTERRSRLHLLAYSPDGIAENVRNAIVQRLGGLRHTVHTLTADNGKEFADHQFITACLQSDFYFAGPYCA